MTEYMEIIRNMTAIERKASKERGELAIRGLSNKAMEFYNETDPLDVYELEDGRFIVNGCIEGDFGNLEAMEAGFLEIRKELWEED